MNYLVFPLVLRSWCVAASCHQHVMRAASNSVPRDAAFIINITGSTAMGLIAGYLAFKGEASQHWRLFLMTGILGGFTHSPAFSLDAALL